MINIVLVDDHEIVRNGLKSLLEKHEDICVVDLYEDGEDVLRYLDTVSQNDALSKPIDVVIIDINMKKINGLQVLEKVRKMALTPPIHFLVLTFFNDFALQKQCEHLGAKGCLSKDCEVDELVHAVRQVVSGKTYFKHVAHASNEEIFTEKELAIISCMSQGMTNKEIAAHLFLSLGTVKNYNSAIYAKLDVKQRPQALSRLKKMGLM